ncbi:MAG: hypothetical protein Q4E65_05995 [Clostridia bacterium]|nr:hypothetical protein [Clostridia bacterium]
MSHIEKLFISPQKGIWQEVPSAALCAHGMEKDRFAGRARQLSLCDGAWRDKVMQSDGFCKGVGPNIVTRGLAYASLHAGDRFRLADAVIEIARVGKECHADCACYHQEPPCLFYQNFAFAKVICGGVITAGDEMRATAQ